MCTPSCTAETTLPTACTKCEKDTRQTVLQIVLQTVLHGNALASLGPPHSNINSCQPSSLWACCCSSVAQHLDVGRVLRSRLHAHNTAAGGRGDPQGVRAAVVKGNCITVVRRE